MDPKVSMEVLQKIEKEIANKYGIEATMSPRAFWNDEKEKEYREQVDVFLEKEENKRKNEEKIEKDGILVPRRLFIEENNKKGCKYCQKYFLDFRDKAYISKYDGCYECYINFIEGRKDKSSQTNK